MTLFVSILILVILIGAVERTDARPAVRVRNSRAYQSSRRTVIDLASTLRGRPALYINGQRARPQDLAAPAVEVPKPAAKPTRRAPIAYAPPPAASGPAPAGDGKPASPGGVTVEFFQGVLMLVNAPYEGPNDALRQLRALGEGGRQWNNGLIRLHQRMSDPGDMRIDPFVADHVVKAAALGQAMVLELIEADSAMTALLNMTLAEIQERGLQVPNTK